MCFVCGEYCVRSEMEEGAQSDECLKECKYIACHIQTCLSRYDYDEKKCSHVTKLWDDCCKKIKEKQIEKIKTNTHQN
jgi:hypothetical protein